MNVALIILGHFFTFVATIAGLLLGLSFTKAEFAAYPILHLLDGQRIPLAVTTVVSLVIVLVTNLLKDVKKEFETVQGPKGESFQKATESGFEKELNDAADDLKAKAMRYFDVAEEDFKPGSYEDAAKNYQKSLDLLPTMSAYLNAGISWYYVSNYPKAEQAFLAGLKLAQQKEDEKFEGMFFGNIGIVYNNQGRLEKALKAHQKAFQIHKKIGNQLGAASTLINIGIVYVNQGNLEEALKSCQQSLEIACKLDNLLGQAQSLLNIGIVYRNQGNLEKSLKSYQQALEIARKLCDLHGQAASLGNIGIIYSQKGKREEALEVYQQSLEIYKNIGDQLGQANAFGNIGIIYFQKGKQEKALEAYQQSLEIHKKIGNARGQAQTLGNIGNVYYNQDKLEKALRSHQQALDINRDIGNWLGEAQDLTRIGNVYFQQGKLEEALGLHLQARDIFERIGAQSELQLVEKNIKRITQKLQSSKNS